MRRFVNKGGVGKTTLVYHIAWMMKELGKKVLAADLDPQANLSSMFLDEERLETLWAEAPHCIGMTSIALRSQAMSQGQRRTGCG